MVLCLVKLVSLACVGDLGSRDIVLFLGDFSFENIKNKCMLSLGLVRSVSGYRVGGYEIFTFKKTKHGGGYGDGSLFSS